MNCGKLNHYAVACRTREEAKPKVPPRPRTRSRRTARQVLTVPEEEEELDESFEEDEEEEEEAVADAIRVRPKRTAKIRLISSLSQPEGTGHRRFRPRCDITIGDSTHQVILDTGAAVNVISKRNFLQLKPRPVLKPATVILLAYGSSKPLPVAGTFISNISFGATEAKARFHVVDRNTETLLGCRSALKLEMVKFAFSILQQDVKELLARHPKLFRGIGCRKGKPIQLHIDTRVPPVANKHRRVPFHQREKVKKELEELEKQDIIEKVHGPTPWVSPMVVAKKPKQPEKVRICVDMREPNVAIRRERHITPTIEELLADLTGACVFSKLDLRSGYHQLPLHPKSRYITTFSTHIGLRRYKRLSFGINSAAEVFQNAIQVVIQDLPGVINISDDILVFANNPKDHYDRLAAVLQRLEEQGLTLHEDKCQFAKEELEFFGYILNKSGVSADPKKVQDIKNAPPPQTASAVRSFLGMANYCGRFIPHLASVSEPLRNLTKSNTRWAWTLECDQAFTWIKEHLSAETTLAYYDLNRHTELLVDASPVGLGAVLTQRNEHGEILPIAYASRALTDTEQRYSQIEKEAIAVLWGCRHFHLYLYGHPFVVMTDHKPLVPIFAGSAPHPPARIEKWMLQLQVYTFELKYRAGQDNPADFLSRHPRPATAVEAMEAAETEAHVRL